MAGVINKCIRDIKPNTEDIDTKYINNLISQTFEYKPDKMKPLDWAYIRHLVASPP